MYIYEDNASVHEGRTAEFWFRGNISDNNSDYESTPINNKSYYFL